MRTLIKIYLLDLFRNKTMGLMVVLVPIIFYPLLYWGITQFLMLKTGLSESRTVRLNYSIEHPEFAAVEDSLSAIKNIELNSTEIHDPEKESISLIITEFNGLPKYEVFLDSSNTAHKDIYPLIESKLVSYYDKKVEERIEKSGYGKEYFQVCNIRPVDVEGEHEVIVKILSIFIPLFSVMSILGSCVAASVELTSGHSEDKTSETTLSLPVDRKKILISKFLSVTIYGIIAGTVNFTLLVAFMIQLFKNFFDKINEGLSTFDWYNIINLRTFSLSFASLALTAFFVALIFVTAAGFASKRKEGSVMVSPFMALMTYLPLVIVIPAMEPNIIIAITPVLNVAFSMKLIISDDMNMIFIAESIFFSVLWTAVVYRYLLPFLLEEEVLLGYSNTTLSKKIKKKLGKWKKK